MEENLASRKGHASSLDARLAPLLNHPALRAACGAASGLHEPVTVSGLTPSAKACVVAAVWRSLTAQQRDRPFLVLTADNESADRLSRSLMTFLGWLQADPGSVACVPAFDCSPYEGRSPHPEILERRALALWNIARGRARLVVAPLGAALGRFAEPAYYRSLALELKTGDELSLSDFAEHLAGIGYEAAEPVTAPGIFSVRGGIVDVFPPESDWPLRIEFFGDVIESMREFDANSQRSRRTVESASVLPLSETRRSRGLFQVLVQRLAAREAGGEREPSWVAEYSAPFPGWEFFAPLAEPRPNTLAGLLAQARRSAAPEHGNAVTGPVVIWDEPPDRERQLGQLNQAWQEGYDRVRDMSPQRPRPEEVFLTEAHFWKSLEASPRLGLKQLGIEGTASPPSADVRAPASEQARDEAMAPEMQSSGGLAMEAAGGVTDGAQAEANRCDGPERWSGSTSGSPPLNSPIGSFEEVALLAQPPLRHHGALKTWTEELRTRIAGGETVILALAASGRVERLHEILGEYGVPFGDERTSRTTPVHPRDSRAITGPRVEDAESAAGAEPAGKLPLLIVRGDLEEGVSFPDLRILIESDSDVFGGFDWGRPGRRDRSSVISTFVSDLSDLKVGDYVVHLDHGIGLYEGLRQIEVEGKNRDFMLLTYQDQAKLYVPLERLDLVEKYRSGGEGVKPALDRLGGATWVRTKTRVKRALRDMAEELLKLYAQRKMSGGLASAPDTPWQQEFEEAFEFEETPDQLSALGEIKRDLESPEPMDRLLCGDVGYGKTELAMRAAFKVVQDGRQAAVLTPTTVLAFQHWNTFRQRMAAFPIRIEMLSRFRSAAEQKSVVADVQAGRVDIVIGTHRLLSKDVAFRDLGLLIVDEEQRFGVAAKEKLKKFRANVDVLTLTATPIPRTLHMSLGGLRDLSVIETPPRGRLAIQTVVAPFSDAVVQAAVLNEMAREGQVYFVHNRVDSIFGMAALIQRLVPTARIGVGHGQMGEKELERVMLKFIEYKYDVFVSTSIIENGLDIPRANTLIVNHADRFGLADLYQLRGRVGRSDRRAYAYLLIRAEDSLTPIARRRLAALKEFSDLGAGFRLAALDLELRGAGNLLGAEQSGHLNAIGLDLYLKMLEQTVEELKGHVAAPEVHTTLNLGLDIKIPATYIADEIQRLRMYKRISSVAGESERTDLESELHDRYGPLPSAVTTLLGYALLKATAEEILISSIERKEDEVWIRFHPNAPIDPDKLRRFMRTHGEAVLRPEGSLRFRVRARDSQLLAELRTTLQEIRASN